MRMKRSFYERSNVCQPMLDMYQVYVNPVLHDSFGNITHRDAHQIAAEESARKVPQSY